MLFRSGLHAASGKTVVAGKIARARGESFQVGEPVRQAFAASEERRRSFRALTRATRARLSEIYEQKEALTHDHQALKAMKTEAMDAFRKDYAALRSTWQATPAQLAGYDRWVAKANNASFAAQAAYDEWVPAFEALFDQSGRRWQPFYDEVRKLAALPRQERADRLRALRPGPASAP